MITSHIKIINALYLSLFARLIKPSPHSLENRAELYMLALDDLTL